MQTKVATILLSGLTKRGLLEVPQEIATARISMPDSTTTTGSNRPTGPLQASQDSVLAEVPADVSAS